MANPIHLLKQAIALANWPMVREAYETLAGEQAPKTPSEAVSNAKIDDLVVHALTGPLVEMPRGAQVAYPLPDFSQPTEATTTTVKPPPVGTATASAGIVLASASDLPKPPEPAKPVPPHRVNIEDFRIRKEPQPNQSAAAGPRRIEAPRQNRSVPVDDREREVPVRDRDTLKRRRIGSEHVGERQCRTEQFVPGDGSNQFADDGKACAREGELDRLLVEKCVRTYGRLVDNRPPMEMVEAQCRACQNWYEMPAADALEVTSGSGWVCQGCIKREKSSRR